MSLSSVVEVEETFSVETITVEHAASIIESNDHFRYVDVGSLRVHHLRAVTGRSMLVQGPNGEFLLVK
jgi:hypothetical protein